MESRQRTFARRMRAEPTEAERVLWQRLRHDIKLTGSHFRRQAQIGPFIVDFASHKLRLIIELDGGQHQWRREEDLSRARQIEAAGYRILRFWNNDVFENIEGVLDEIQRALPPTPDPSPQRSIACAIARRGRGADFRRGESAASTERLDKQAVHAKCCYRQARPHCPAGDSPHRICAICFKERARPTPYGAKSSAPKNSFRLRFQYDHIEQSVPPQIFTFAFSESMLLSCHPVSPRGAFRDRHETRGGDAVAARCRSMSFNGVRTNDVSRT